MSSRVWLLIIILGLMPLIMNCGRKDFSGSPEPTALSAQNFEIDYESNSPGMEVQAICGLPVGSAAHVTVDATGATVSRFTLRSCQGRVFECTGRYERPFLPAADFPTMVSQLRLGQGIFAMDGTDSSLQVIAPELNMDIKRFLNGSPSGGGREVFLNAGPMVEAIMASPNLACAVPHN